MPKPSTSKHKKNVSSVSNFLTVLSNIFSIGITAATSTTVALATDAAATASEYTVKPFNTLVRSATQKYFAPQIAYSSYSIRWNMAGRKRAATEEVIFTRSAETVGRVANGVARRNSLARPSGSVPARTGIGPPRSSSVPVITALDIPDLPARRKRKPTLTPINTSVPTISIPRSDSSPSPLSYIPPYPAFHGLPTSPSGLHTPLLSTSNSASEGSWYSQPNTPRMACSPMQGSPLRNVTSNESNTHGQMYSKSIPIARFSFWNLVGLGEGQYLKEGGTGDCAYDPSGKQKHQISDSGPEEEDVEEEEPESYRRLCYL